MSSASAGQYERMQAATFTAWINSRLRAIDLAIESLNDLGDGITLIRLLELLSGAAVNGGKYSKNPRMRMQIVDNLSLGLDAARAAGLPVTAKPANFLDQDIKMILGFVWVLICHYQISTLSDSAGAAGDDESSDGQPGSGEGSTDGGGAGGSSGPGGPGSGSGGGSRGSGSRGKSKSGASSAGAVAKELLAWVQKTMRPYALSVGNLTSAFSDGRVFCALCEVLDPQSLAFADIPQEPEARLALAFATAESAFDIPKLLVPEAVAEMPDKYSIMTYLSYFRAFQVTAQHAAAESHAKNKALAEAEKKLQGTEQSKAALEANVAQLEATVQGLEATVSTQAADLAAAEAKLADEQASKVALCASVEELEAAVHTLEDTVSTQSAALADTESKLAASLTKPASNTVATQTGPFDELDLVTAAVDAAVSVAVDAAVASTHQEDEAAADASIAALSAEKDALADELETCRTHAAEAESQLASLQAELDAARAERDAARGERDAARAERDGAQTNTDARITQLQAERDAAQSEAAHARTETAAYGEKVASLRAKRDALAQQVAELGPQAELADKLRAKLESETTKRKALKELSLTLRAERDELEAKVSAAAESSEASMDELRETALAKVASSKKKTAAYKIALAAEKEKNEQIMAKALKLKSTNSALKDELRALIPFKDALAASKAKNKALKARLAEMQGQLEASVTKLIKQKEKTKVAVSAMQNAKGVAAAAEAAAEAATEAATQAAAAAAAASEAAGPSKAPHQDAIDTHNIHDIEEKAKASVAAELSKQRKQILLRMEAAKARKRERLGAGIGGVAGVAGGGGGDVSGGVSGGDGDVSGGVSGGGGDVASDVSGGGASKAARAAPKVPVSLAAVEDRVVDAVGAELVKQKEMMAARIAKLKERKALVKAGKLAPLPKTDPVTGRPAVPTTTPTAPVSPDTGSGKSRSSKRDKAMISALQKKLSSVKKKNKQLASKLTTVKKAKKVEKVKGGMGDTFAMETKMVTSVGTELDKQRERTIALLKAAKARKASNRAKSGAVEQGGGGSQASRSNARSGPSITVNGGGGRGGPGAAGNRSTHTSHSEMLRSLNATEDSVVGAVSSELNKQRLMMEAMIKRKKAAKAAKAAGGGDRSSSGTDGLALPRTPSASDALFLRVPSPVPGASPSLRMSASMSDFASSAGDGDGDGDDRPVDAKSAAAVKAANRTAKAYKKKYEVLKAKVADIKAKNKKLVAVLETRKTKEKATKLKAGMGTSVFESEAKLVGSVRSELDKQREKMRMTLAAAKKRKAEAKARSRPRSKSGAGGGARAQAGSGAQSGGGGSDASGSPTRGNLSGGRDMLNVARAEASLRSVVEIELAKQRRLARDTMSDATARKRQAKGRVHWAMLRGKMLTRR